MSTKQLTDIKTLDELKACHIIALIADTDKYWTRWGSEDVRAAKTVYQYDEYCQFAISFDVHDLISLQADTGKYLSRWDDEDLRAAKDQIDQYCKFIVAPDGSGKGFTLKGDTGRYISRWGDEGLRIAKEHPDAYTIFRIQKVQ